MMVHIIQRRNILEGRNEEDINKKITFSYFQPIFNPSHQLTANCKGYNKTANKQTN